MQRLTILLVAVLLVSSASAEILELDRNRAGFFVGLNLANQGGEMDELADQLAQEMGDLFGGAWTADRGANLGLGLGAFYLVQTSPTFGVEIELQYLRRGVKVDLDAVDVSVLPPGTTIENELQVNYVELPLLARFSPAPAAAIRAVFLLGPVLGIKTGANLVTTVQDISESQDFSEGYEDFALGALAGAGVSVQVGTTSFLILQARYYRSLLNPIADGEFDAPASDLGFFAGMEFRLPYGRATENVDGPPYAASTSP